MAIHARKVWLIYESCSGADIHPSFLGISEERIKKYLKEKPFSIREFLEQKELVEEVKRAFNELEAEEALGFLVNLLTKELRAEEEKRWKKERGELQIEDLEWNFVETLKEEFVAVPAKLLKVLQDEAFEVSTYLKEKHSDEISATMWKGIGKSLEGIRNLIKAFYETEMEILKSSSKEKKEAKCKS